jgi:DNA-binding response OmpR family regulator
MSMPTRKILIVEDNEDLQQIYKSSFESAGYEVKISGNGLIGITDVVDYSPSIVLLDIMMPEMNGFEFLEALKNNTSLKIPVIVISNLTQEQEKEKAAKNGASMYLIKSDYEGPDLVAKIDAFLDGLK